MAAGPQQAEPQQAEPTPHRLGGSLPVPLGERLGSLATPPRPTLRREWLLLGLSLLVLAGVVAPPLINLGRYQHRIVEAMSRSLGRPVAMRAVTLRLLPAPALVLEDVVVGEQPGFGAEPALRAPTLTAQLRLTSLWRGQLEVSHVTIADASLNLVRNAAGQWDIGSLLLQASQVPNAPTAQRRPGPAPRFPYIEITDSRVNLKQGLEKLPYSLFNANLSVWLAEPEVWQLKIEGQPVRTDVQLGLSDTGLLRVEGRLHRSHSLGQMPVALRAEWLNAPLGQASRLLSGTDPGWRGNLHATAAFTGALDNLSFQSHLAIDDLHREEFTPAEPFSVDTTCNAHWVRALHLLDQLSCRWPVGEGHLLLTGQALTDGTVANARSAGTFANAGTKSLNAFRGSRSASRTRPAAPSSRSVTPGTSLLLTADRLPASFLLAAAGLARSDFAPRFSLYGSFNGQLTYAAGAARPPAYGGSLGAEEIRLAANGLAEPLVLRAARLTAATPGPTGVPTLVLTSEPVDLGGAQATELNAQVTPQGILLHAGGSASLARLVELGRATHLLPVTLAWLAPVGTAEFDVSRSAAWQLGEPQPESPAGRAGASAFTPAPRTLNGWLRLRAARYAPPFLAEPVLLPTAQATFTGSSIAWTIPAAVVASMRLQLAVTYPLACSADEACAATFHAVSAAVDVAEIRSALLGGSDRKAGTELLGELMGSLGGSSAHWPPLTGTLHADTLTLGRLVMRDADASLAIHDGLAELRSLDAAALGGSLHASGTLRKDGRTPRYLLSTVLSHANVVAAGSLFHENWGTGLLTASSELQLSGVTAAELAGSATGTFEAQWSRGGLGGASPLGRFASWTVDGPIGGGAFTLAHGQVNPVQGPPRPVAGVIGFDRGLQLEVGAPGVSTPSPARPAGSGITPVTGTLAQPVP